jgi:D-alanyl-D-alanine carboxypeptidase
MKRTFYSNSHGLPNNLNKSCASDVSILIDYSLNNDLFRRIIGTKKYECEINV